MSSNATQSELVVGVDGSAASFAAVTWATHEATTRGLSLKLLHVVAPTLISSAEAPKDTITQEQEIKARQVLDRAQQIANDQRGEPRPKLRAEVRYASVLEALVDASRDAHMIAVGTRGLDDFGSHILGSVSSGLLHHAHCPVAVIHEPDSAGRGISEGRPVLLGIDGSPASEAATALAFDEASHRRVPLVALNAWSDVGVFPILGMDWRVHRDEGDEVPGERLAGWHASYPEVQVHRKLVCDVPARWLIDESESAQLVVFGSRGRGGFDDLHLRSVSSAVAQSAHAPVTVVRSGE